MRESHSLKESTPRLPVDLSLFGIGDYHPGRAVVWRALWFFCGLPLLRCRLIPGSAFRRALLTVFGARVGRSVVIKPGVRIKNPWLLSIGDHSWIGEDAWIDNLAHVNIGSHACVSQGAYLCTGNHDWSDPTFRYRLGAIVIEDGAWVGARGVVGPGVTIGQGGVLTAASAAYRDIPGWQVWTGVPARYTKERVVRKQETDGNEKE